MPARPPDRSDTAEAGAPRAGASGLDLAEQARLCALRRYQVLDTPAEESFDRIARLAQAILHVQIVWVSLLDESRQWFKTRLGSALCETPRAISFCTHTIQTAEPFIVNNAAEDPRFRDNPLVTDLGLHFYLGVPLRTHDGQNIGTLCALDPAPRGASAEEIAAMQDLARLVMDELELRLLATTDSLTGAATRRGFWQIAEKAMAQAHRHERALACIMVDIDHFKRVNDRHGHAAGDCVLQRVAQVCLASLRESDTIGRLGGEEFGIVLPEASLATASFAAERLRRSIAAAEISIAGQTVSVTASLGVSALLPADRDFHAMLDRADLAMYEAKQAGRNRVVTLAGAPDAALTPHEAG